MKDFECNARILAVDGVEVLSHVGELLAIAEPRLADHSGAG